MKKIKFVVLSLLASAISVSTSFAQETNNIGTCGWGSKLFENDKGIAPQVLAVTTNGTFGNQTFGISSATSGCTRDGVVRSNWKTVMYIDGNKERLAKDVSFGKGESVETLASLIGIKNSDKPAFYALTQKEFSKIFSTNDVKSSEVVASLKAALKNSDTLSKYSKSL